MSKENFTTPSNPIAKLEADNYGAEDLDGVTESLFGSGNLNYLTLQSQQNDLMAQSAAAGESAAHDVSLTNLASGIASGHGPGLSSHGFLAENAATGLSDDGALGLGDYSGFGQGVASLVPTISGGGDGRSGGDGSDGSRSSIFSSSSSSSSERTDIRDAINGDNGNNGENGAGSNGTNGNNGTNGSNGANGADGRDGTNPPGGGDDDVDVHVDTGLTGPLDVNPIVDVILDPIEDIVGDIDVIVGNGLDLGDIADTVQDALTDPAGAVNDTVGQVLDGVGGVLGSILPQSPGNDTDLHLDLGVGGPMGVGVDRVVDQVLDPLENIVGDIDINVLPNIDLNNGAMDLNLDSIVANLPLLDGGAHLGMPVLEAMGQAVNDLPQVEDLLSDPQAAVEDLTGSVQNIVETLLAGGQGEGAENTDLHLGLGDGMQPLDLNLDPLEAIVGDIDLDLTNQLDLANLPGALGDTLDNVAGLGPVGGLLDDLTGDLGAGPLPGLDLSEGLDLGEVANLDLPALDAVTDTLGDLPGLLSDPQGGVDALVADAGNIVEGLLGGGSGEGADDMDLHLDLGNGTQPIDVNLDPLEAILGDIDMDATNPVDLQNLPGMLDGLASGDTQAGLQDLLGQAGGLGGLGDLGGGAQDAGTAFTDDLSGQLQDPAGMLGGIADSDGLSNLLNGGPDNGDTATDNDLTLNPGLDILGGTTPSSGITAVLDPLESVMGDMDINVDAAIDALNGGGVQDLISISGSSTGSGEGGIWPQNPVTAATESVFDTTLGDGAAALPEPSGTVAEGLGILNLGGDHGGHHGGGGHGLFGGLFG